MLAGAGVTLGTALTGGAIAAGGLMAVQLYNSFAEKDVGHAIGTRAASAIGDVGTGAAIGAGFGTVVPGIGTLFGAAAGAAIGAVVSQVVTGGPSKNTSVAQATAPNNPNRAANELELQNAQGGGPLTLPARPPAYMQIPSAAITAARDYATNVSLLAQATGLAQPQVLQLAQDLGINLHNALSPGQVQTFTGAVHQAGGATGETATLAQQASMKVQSALIEMSEAAAKNMPGIPAAIRDAIVAAQPPLLGLVTQLNKTGDTSAAGFITAFLAHVPAAELASKKMHDGVHSPLYPLELELEGVGDTSAANMIKKFIAHQPGATQAAGQMHDGMKNPLYTLETELGLIGDTGGAQLVQNFLKHNPAAASAAGLTHDSVTGKLIPLEQGLMSIGDTSAANFVQGLGSQDAAAGTAGTNLGNAFVHGAVQAIQGGGISQSANAVLGTISSGISILQQEKNAALSGLPGHASGGYMSAGDIAIVGEKGPEIFAAGYTGAILPIAAGGSATSAGGGGGVTIGSINIGGGVDADEVGRQVANQVRVAQMRKARQQGPIGGVYGKLAGSR